MLMDHAGIEAALASAPREVPGLTLMASPLFFVAMLPVLLGWLAVLALRVGLELMGGALLRRR